MSHVRDHGNDDGYTIIRPKKAHVKLFADGAYVLTATLSDENNWFVVYEVPKYNDEGTEIHYEWKETEVPGYHVESTYEIDVVTTVVNRVYEIPIWDPDTPGKPPKLPGKPMTILEEYDTPLGVEIVINHVGDCFD